MRSRFGLKALGLCALLVGLMAFGAGAAQAEVGAYWLVSGKKITNELLPEATATIEAPHSILLTKLSNKNIHLLCTTVELEEAHAVEPNGGLLGKAKFSGCKFFELLVGGGTKEVGACNPKEGIILTNKVLGLITLHESKGRVTLKPEGETFATIFLGAECAFGEKLKVGGVLVLKECKDAFLTDQVTHLVEEDKVLTKLWVNSTTNPATIDGSATVALGGAHKGLTFAGHPA